MPKRTAPVWRALCAGGMGLFLLCLAPCAQDAQREPSGPSPLIERIRKGEPLADRDKKYVQKVMRERNYTTPEQVADHLEECYWESERLAVQEGRRTGRAAPASGAAPAGSPAAAPEEEEEDAFRSFFPYMALCGLVLAGDLVWVLVRRRMRDRARIQALQRAGGAGELLTIAPKDEPTGDHRPENPVAP